MSDRGNHLLTSASAAVPDHRPPSPTNDWINPTLAGRTNIHSAKGIQRTLDEVYVVYQPPALPQLQ